MKTKDTLSTRVPLFVKQSLMEQADLQNTTVSRVIAKILETEISKHSKVTDNQSIYEFLMEHKSEINKYACDLDLFTEDEYSGLSIFTSEMSDFMGELTKERFINDRQKEKIKELLKNYEQLLNKE